MPQLGCCSSKVCDMLWSREGDGVASKADSAFGEELQVHSESHLMVRQSQMRARHRPRTS